VLALPGIGRYTAGAIGSIAFNQPTPILDGNVIRVLTRLSGIRENPREKRTNAQLWQLAEELVTGAASHSPLLPINLATADVRRHALDPGADGADSRRRLRFRGSTGENFFGGSSIRNSESRTASAKSQAPIAIGRSPISNSQTPNAELRTPNTGLLFSGPCSALNQSLMELGATICLPRTPRCTECPLEKICVARRDDLTDQIPNLGPRPTATRRRFVAFVAQRHGRLLVRQRGPAELNGSLWEFPNLEAISETEPAAQLATRLFGTRVAPAPLCRINHSITRYRIELDAFTVTLDDTERKRLPPGRWIPLSKVDNLAFTSAHRKILTHFLRRVAPR
jgi:adenine-specific DNA glycosylase